MLFAMRIVIIACSLLLIAGGAGPGTAEAHDPPNVKRALPTADVLIDAGHGGIDGGTHWNGILEKDINLAISRKLYLLLRARGLKVILNRTGDYALSDDNRWHLSRSRHRRDLSQRRGLSDEIGAALFVSVHVNWSPKGSKRGPLVIHQAEGGSALLAKFIQDSLNRQQNKFRLPQVANQYYLLNRVQVPSVIVETAFLSDPADRAMLTSIPGQNRIAAAIASGIIAYRLCSP
ncbi:N-acetylmuramoyl-L-alanine amidase [Cohnella sp. SGD-V74]|uniref:N-acetylmuramoyl-L-alanine amidase family protein n=1 Tax=unclassified Cohnella TaxID=2636738 RepID=UPI000D429EEF|nr:MULTISPECIES: N-acetylmuramoyl-L-alanine amidase [unclassified Cohnella]PRX63954.1 N-acetylmuramoyl-L-alanine amidase [Cohnella sp. SGD-V74]